MSDMGMLRQLTCFDFTDTVELLEHNKAEGPFGMSEPEGWTRWAQAPLVVLLVLGAALAWFTTGYSGGLLVAGFGVLCALYLRYKNSN